MKTQNILKVVAPLLVATGIATVIYLVNLGVSYLGIIDFHAITNAINMPLWVVLLVGFMNAMTFTLFFIAGFIKLGRKGAVGDANELKTKGAYKYVRNPMYSGVSFTVFGIGLLLGNTSLVLAGLVWLIICFFVVLGEERALENKYGEQYLHYKAETPRFVPDFQLLAYNIMGKKNLSKRKQKTKKVSILGNK